MDTGADRLLHAIVYRDTTKYFPTLIIVLLRPNRAFACVNAVTTHCHLPLSHSLLQCTVRLKRIAISFSPVGQFFSPFALH